MGDQIHVKPLVKPRRLSRLFGEMGIEPWSKKRGQNGAANREERGWKWRSCEMRKSAKNQGLIGRGWRRGAPAAKTRRKNQKNSKNLPGHDLRHGSHDRFGFVAALELARICLRRQKALSDPERVARSSRKRADLTTFKYF